MSVFVLVGIKAVKSQAQYGELKTKALINGGYKNCSFNGVD
jgi:hypothetical protein